MCGCGAFFCRRCSPSRIFCQRCEGRRQNVRGNQQLALAHPGIAGGRPLAPAHPAALSRRLFLEVLITLVAATLAIAAAMGWQDRSLAYEPNPTVSFGINAGMDPQQTYIGSFNQTIHENGTSAEISGDSSYTINARVQSVHEYRDAISGVIPYDLLLGWGGMADESLAGNLAWEQANRRGMVSGTISGSGGSQIDTSYVVSHVSNNHMIPANEKIRTALARIEPGDIVRIDGRLVDVKAFVSSDHTLTISTSKSRTDQGDGACEVIYVEHLRVNGETF